MILILSIRIIRIYIYFLRHSPAVSFIYHRIIFHPFLDEYGYLW